MIIVLVKKIFDVYNEFNQLYLSFNKRGVEKMAKNTGDNHRHGAVCNRSQAYNPKSGT